MTCISFSTATSKDYWFLAAPQSFVFIDWRPLFLTTADFRIHAVSFVAMYILATGFFPLLLSG